MFDAIRDLAGKALDRSLTYARHCAAIDEILKCPTEETAVQALRDHVSAIDGDGDFQLFQAAIHQQYQSAQQVQANADSAWGTSFEDRLYYRVANFGAGESTAEAAARQRLASLEVMYQLAEHFRAEAKQARPSAAVDPTSIPR